jgi:hypothetical protein
MAFARNCNTTKRHHFFKNHTSNAKIPKMKLVEGETFQLGAKPISPQVFFHFTPFPIAFKYGLQIHFKNVVS